MGAASSAARSVEACVTASAAESEVEAAVADCVAAHGGLDVIVNAAAVHPYDRLGFERFHTDIAYTIASHSG